MTATDKLAALVRQLRAAMFKPEYSHERIWETEEEEENRELRNRQRKATWDAWDAETERMIQEAVGEWRQVAPGVFKRNPISASTDDVIQQYMRPQLPPGENG